MPVIRSRTGRIRGLAVALVSTALVQGAVAQPAPTSTGRPPVNNSTLDAPLFYQLLVGEMELRAGEAGTAYQVMVDAARRGKNEQLFQRATDIALQARAGDQALSAAKAWREALPESVEAHRYQIQILIALDRPAETLEPLGSLMKLAPAAERSSMLASLPRFFARSADRAAAAALIEQVAQPYFDAPDSRAVARVAAGRGWLAAGDTDKALAAAQRAHDLDPTAEAPAGLGLELLPGRSAAEAVVLSHLKARPDSNAVRLIYVRTLTTAQRFADAVAQLETLTGREPTLAPPWLTLGALHLELRRPAEATAALQKYVDLVQSGSAPEPAEIVVATEAESGAIRPERAEAEDGATIREQALAQAWLLLAQAAEQQKDYPAAEAWLAKIDNPQRVIEVQARRASLLQKQGRLAEARELIRRAPERTAADARSKLLAEVQMLRDAKAWAEANAMLVQANEKTPDDVDLLYEQSMMAEKLDRVDEMERLLRRVIALKPDHHHAYNALGYSLAERNVRLPEARDLIRKALDLSPAEPFITDSLGWVEYRLGNKDEALRLLRSAYQSRPDPEIAAHLGEVLWVSGLTDEARKVWGDARNRDSANDVLRETLARLRVDL